MRKLLSSLLLLASSLAWARGSEQYLEIKDFSCGVDTYHSSLTLNDCAVQDALNVYFDKDAPVVKRGGFTTAFSTKAYSYSGQWSYTDGNSNIWMIVRSSDQITATTGIGTSQFNIKVATVSANDQVSEVSAFGNAYFVDQTQGVYYWNGTAMTAVSGSPLGSIITEYHGRIWVSGLASPNGQRVQGSKYLDGTTWSTNAPSLTTDPVSITVSLADNYDVTTCMFSGFNDSLYIMENTHINQLTGFDSTNFQVAQIGKEVGCISQGSMQQYQGGLVFASLRGIEFFDGYTATKISEPVKNKVDPITVNTSFNSNSWVQSTQADWNAGSYNSSINTTIAAPALVLSTATGTFTDSTNANFMAGTLSNVTVANNTVYVSTNNSGDITNPSFESAFSGNWYSSSTVVLTRQASPYAIVGSGCASITAHNGSWVAVAATGLSNWSANFAAVDMSTAILASVAMTKSNDCTMRQLTLDPGINVGKRVRFRFLVTDVPDVGGSDRLLETADSYIWGGPITFWYATGPGNSNTFTVVDDIKNGSSTITSGSFTSQRFDTTHSSVTAAVTLGTTSNTEPISFSLVTASATTGPWTQIATGNATNLASTRYLQYSATFTVGSGDSALSTINSVSIPWNFTYSSGSWTSPSHNISTATAFGNFSVTEDLTTGGSITFAVCTSSKSNMVPQSCVATLPNSQIAASTNIFVSVSATFTVTSATNVPTLNNFTVNWFSGSRKPPMASVVFDNRYWLSITTNTADSTNDATLVLSKGPIWTIFDIKAGAFVVWKNSLYFADASPTGYAYQLEQGQNDNGVAVNAYIKTKDYAPKGLITDKFFDSMYIVADNLGLYNVYTNYVIDRSTNTMSLGTAVQNENMGTMISKIYIPLDTSHQSFGRTINFTFQQNDLNAPFKFYGATVGYHQRPTL